MEPDRNDTRQQTQHNGGENQALPPTVQAERWVFFCINRLIVDNVILVIDVVPAIVYGAPMLPSRRELANLNLRAYI
jgi:hypothetical protein